MQERITLRIKQRNEKQEKTIDKSVKPKTDFLNREIKSVKLKSDCSRKSRKKQITKLFRNKGEAVAIPPTFSRKIIREYDEQFLKLKNFDKIDKFLA